VWCRVNQDTLGSRSRCVNVATEAILRRQKGQHVLIDRCNLTIDQVCVNYTSAPLL
jgi:hypothetical protein